MYHTTNLLSLPKGKKTCIYQRLTFWWNKRRPMTKQSPFHPSKNKSRSRVNQRHSLCHPCHTFSSSFNQPSIPFVSLSFPQTFSPSSCFLIVFVSRFKTKTNSHVFHFLGVTNRNKRCEHYYCHVKGKLLKEAMVNGNEIYWGTEEADKINSLDYGVKFIVIQKVKGKNCNWFFCYSTETNTNSWTGHRMQEKKEL